MKKATRAGLAAFLILGGTLAYPHCEIPCGIYGDEDRCKALEEHFSTIEKSMRAIVELSAKPGENANQLARWVANKDAHAEEVQHVVSQYFMTQRIKPADPSDAKAREKYVREITLLHAMLVSAMRCKQTTDVAHVADLREKLAAFRESYLGK